MTIKRPRRPLHEVRDWIPPAFIPDMDVFELRKGDLVRIVTDRDDHLWAVDDPNTNTVSGLTLLRGVTTNASCRCAHEQLRWYFTTDQRVYVRLADNTIANGVVERVFERVFEDGSPMYYVHPVGDRQIKWGIDARVSEGCIAPYRNTGTTSR